MRVRERYDDFTAEALDLFMKGEEEVAFCAAVEFYAGWHSPHDVASRLHVPRAIPDGDRIFYLGEYTVRGALADGETGDLPHWVLARPQELVDWANVVWPWEKAMPGDRGTGSITQ